MTITEYAILPFKSHPDFSDPVLRSLFDKLSTWQSECSGFPLRFHADTEAPHEVYLVTGWKSVGAHEAWIQGERNQELLRVFAPYVDIPKVRMVHIDVDFEAMPRDAGNVDDVIIVERYDSEHWDEMAKENPRGRWELVGRDLADDEDVFRFVGVAEGGEVNGEGVAPTERWMLKRIEL